MADKGFQIHLLLAKRGSRLWLPYKREKGQSQVGCHDEVISEEIANIRIHVERGMRRLKEWQTLDKSLKISRKDLWSSTIFVCTMLCNLQPTLDANIGEPPASTPLPNDV